MANRIKKKQETKSTVQENVALIMGIFTLAVLCGLPVVFHNAYFDILETKYRFYCAVSITMIIVMAVYGLINGKIVSYFKTFRIQNVVKSLNVVDWAMLIFWMANILSWIFCTEWRWEAFWGTSGRYTGAFLITIYMVVYFIVTRCFVFRRWYLDAFLAVGLFVCLFGITDYFQMDIFGFKVRMVPTQKAIYTSTLGNINTYTVYVGAVMVISMILFAMEKNQKRMIWYYGCLVVSCFALIMGCSDNAYLTLAALFGLSPLYLFRTKTGTGRYLVSLATFFTVIQCIDWINAAYADTIVGIDSAFNIIAGMKSLPVIVIGLWAIAAGVTVLFMKQKKSAMAADKENADTMGKGLFYAWIGVIVLVVGIVAFAFYDATVAGNSERYGALAPYVTFNDAWGTKRGYVWKCSMDIWANKLTPLQKIIGYGADTFRLLMQVYYPGEITNGKMVIYDSAHNEYLQYLVTVGVVGMVSYLVFMVSSVVTMVGRIKEHPEVAAVMFAIAAYAVQALVNINLPIIMPVILQLLAMGLAKVPAAEEKSGK